MLPRVILRLSAAGGGITASLGEERRWRLLLDDEGDSSSSGSTKFVGDRLLCLAASDGGRWRGGRPLLLPGLPPEEERRMAFYY